jgi:hypothetical protein
MFNSSGMHRVAESMVKIERELGLDSMLVNMHATNAAELDEVAKCDIFVPHTHFPNEVKKRLTKPLKMVFLSHGTPEYIVNSAFADGKQGYGHGDGLMLWMHWMKTADAVCTFWPRHQAIMQSMCDKATKVHLVPLGLDHAFWKAAPSKGKFSGNPSVMTSENSHSIKWAYDLFICWSWIYDKIPDACLHATYVPTDQHRYWFPLINRNGTSYGAHVSPLIWQHDELRSILKSVDYYCNLVRYGDFNHMGLQAALCGTKVISYRGNPFSDFWITEGDQRGMADELLAIFRGEVKPRVKDVIPALEETGLAMKAIYETVLAGQVYTTGVKSDTSKIRNSSNGHAGPKRNGVAVRVGAGRSGIRR